ncbi:unnamed protein product [Lymnaea stagnalis]|uniref:Uncharacterized protein n=1 Tax=Lymnaea stagnalis TaxID=6523 RepID=A0AAV2HZW1_LYMST
MNIFHKDTTMTKPTRKEAPLPPEPPLKSQGEHNYEQVGTQDDNHYDKLVYTEESEISARLKEIETNQAQMLGEIRRLNETMEHLKTMNINLQKAVVESSSVLQETVASLKKEFLETSDHLGQHIIQVRRDIVGLSKREPASLSSPQAPEPPAPRVPTDTRVKHVFEWDIQGVDNLVKTQGQVSSHSYHIGDLNYKVLGGADFTKDGQMYVRIYGESTHPSGNDHLTKSGRFQCKVSVTDRSGNMVDWVVGKAVGNFFQDKMWMVGSVSVAELKKKGYCVQGKTFKMKFAIDVFK